MGGKGMKQPAGAMCAWYDRWLSKREGGEVR